jgi:signal transduction histidine kinase/tetratricopeptide (TPR) repeat protein
LKFNDGLIAGRNQLQWVVLLLAAAVVLPTVALLWFMSRVVANERLATREKLASLYQDKLVNAADKTEAILATKLKTLDKTESAANPYSIFKQLVLDSNFQGVVVQDAAGKTIYPVQDNIAGSEMIQNSPLAEARKTEFAQKQYAAAVNLYDGFLTDSDARVVISAIMGKSRCLAKLGRVDEAIDACQKAAFYVPEQKADTALLVDIQNARLLLLSLLKQNQLELKQRTLNALISDLYNSADLPSAQNLFVAKKILQILDETPALETKTPVTKDNLVKLAAAEELSISVAENHQLLNGQLDTFQRIDVEGKPIYGFLHKSRTATLLALFDGAGIESIFAGYRDVFAGSESDYRIIDDKGRLVAGNSQSQDKPFTTAALARQFPGWKVEMYFKGGEVFEKAAKKQIAIYLWTGALVIMLIVVAGGFATQAVGRQIRLNKMKNDFIATVSHELKTPLASMRVLVDTLLEGNVKDENQTEEYLRMTSKENERLSRMIDNFLTFSRMERNKKAFTIVDCAPAAIAKDAAEAVKTKFAANNCRFTIDIADNLPDIQADHDAMVTVLVNLLDNACKYTGDDKQIALKVFVDAGCICFVVSDNGIGLARRHIRRIFDSFYQVDNSLARKVEGCGLGLSIVKFILDAQKGTISVDSKPGKGSTFTVKIPLSPGEKDAD